MIDKTRRIYRTPSDIKIEVILSDLPAGVTMDDIDFTVKFATPTALVTKSKAALVRLDGAAGGRYIACLKSSELTQGDIIMTVDADIPDDAFEGGLRKDVVSVDTKATII